MEKEKKTSRLAELANKVRKTFAYSKAKLISDFTESFSMMMDRRGVNRAELARRIAVKPPYAARASVFARSIATFLHSPTSNLASGAYSEMAFTSLTLQRPNSQIAEL